MTFAYIIASNKEQHEEFVTEFKKVFQDNVVYVDCLPKDDISDQQKKEFRKKVNVRGKTVLVTEWQRYDDTEILDDYQTYDHGDNMLYCLDKKTIEGLSYHHFFIVMTKRDDQSMNSFVESLK